MILSSIASLLNKIHHVQNTSTKKKKKSPNSWLFEAEPDSRRPEDRQKPPPEGAASAYRLANSH